jgi:putative ABC transport system permease protein
VLSWLSGAGVGLLVLMSFAAPPVIALRRVPALRVLRRDIPINEPSAWITSLIGLAGLSALLWWKAGSATLGGLMLSGIGITLLVLAALAAALLWILIRVRSRLRGVWRFGFANVTRRASVSIAQVSALGLGLMVLLLLVLVRTDLLSRWQQTLPSNAPNRFIINVQEDQVEGVSKFFTDRGLKDPELTPMIRARLVALNDRPTSGESYSNDDQRAQRFAEREFNLSSAKALRADNEIVAGTFWNGKPANGIELSVEEEFAATLRWKLGDKVRFDVAGAPLEGNITSLRKVQWESFKPNFFVLVSPGGLEGLSASYISAVNVPEAQKQLADDVVREYPNLSVVNIDAVLTQVRDTITQVSRVVESVFYFSVIAGLLVLFAAVQSAQDERMREGSVMRALGGSTWQLRVAQVIEFSLLGLLSGAVAAIAASSLAGGIAEQVFQLPWTVNWPLVSITALIGVGLTLLAGLWATRDVVRVSPTVVLRELA